MTKGYITSKQFFSLLYLSVLGSVFMYISSPEITIARTESLLRPVVFFVFSIIVMIPVYCICKKNPVVPCVNSPSDGSNIVLKTVAVVYSIVYLADALITVARFDLFASFELFPGTDMTFFIIGLVLVCAYIAMFGIRGLARAAVIFTVIVVSATAFAMFTLGKEIDFLNFTPLFEDGIGKFVTDSLSFCVQASELGAILLFAPRIKGDIKKTFVGWLGLSAVTFSLILFFVVGSLGAFADTQLFPTYISISLAQFGLFERLDALETAIWILCVVSKLTMYLIIISQCISFSFKKIPLMYSAGGAAAIICAVVIYVSGNIEHFDFLSFMPLVVTVFAVPVLVLPGIILCVRKVKGGDAVE